MHCVYNICKSKALYYGTAINKKYTNINVFTITKQELTQNNQTSSEEKIYDISQVMAKKISFFCKKKPLPAAYQLKVTTKIIEKCYSQ